MARTVRSTQARNAQSHLRRLAFGKSFVGRRHQWCAVVMRSHVGGNPAIFEHGTQACTGRVLKGQVGARGPQTDGCFRGYGRVFGCVPQGLPHVERAVINKTQNKKGEPEYELLVEGSNLRGVMATPGVVGEKTTSNHITEVRRAMGAYVELALRGSGTLLCCATLRIILRPSLASVLAKNHESKVLFAPALPRPIQKGCSHIRAQHSLSVSHRSRARPHGFLPHRQLEGGHA